LDSLIVGADINEFEVQLVDGESTQ
jgi:hypothetical protein